MSLYRRPIQYRSTLEVSISFFWQRFSPPGYCIDLLMSGGISLRKSDESQLKVTLGGNFKGAIVLGKTYLNVGLMKSALS